MPEILLIDPPWVIENEASLWKNIGSCFPGLGLAYIAAVLENNGHSTAIVDCRGEGLSVSGLENRLRDFVAPKWIGITATSALIENALLIASISKKKFPEAVVILGGVHPTVQPEETLKHPDVDLVVRGEGEVTMLEIVSSREVKSIKGLSYRNKGGKVIHNPSRALIKNLDEIPLPAYHLLPMHKYYPAIGSYKRLPAMSIFATRGCVGRCLFCYKTFFGRVRKRSAENIIKEVEHLVEIYGIKEIAFYDDTFTIFKKEVKRFVDLLIEKKIDITWSCFTRVDCVDQEILLAMKKGGCHLILIGVESANEGILKKINKRISLEKVNDVVRLARKIGIETRASFMFGNPGETEETIKQTINFAIKLDPDEVQFNIATAYPGTGLYAWAEKEGYLRVKNNKNFNMSDINMELPTVTNKIIRKYYKIAHRSFYFRLPVILRRLRRIRSLTQLNQEIKGGLAIFKI